MLALVLGAGGVYAAEEQAPETDGEIWNRGVELYREGNMTNALAVLKPLILSKTHGARASELVGAIEFAQGLKRDGDGAAEPLRALESAAVDFQTALRANPEDSRRNRNFTRAADRLPELREQAHVEKVMKELGQQDAGGLLGAGVHDARSMMKEFPVAITNVDARVAVAKCEAMAKRAERLCDTWIAVKAGVAQSVTNEQQAMTITAQVEEARTATEEAAKALGDIDPVAQDALAKAETSLTRFWKLAIMPPAACDEAILSQSNSVVAAETVNGRDWQREALDFTRAFRAKFPMWAQAYEQQAQADTNKPPFTKEAQDEISALATEVEKLQIELAGEEMKLANVHERKGGGKAADHAAKELKVLDKLNRIRELLPKDKNGGGQNQQNQQNQQNKDNQNQDQQNQQDQNKDQNKDQGQQGQDQQNQDEDKNKENEEKKDEEQQSAAEEKKDDRQVEEMIRKAQERNDQHEADKKARMRKAPLPANERDW
jgi:hypothetical protein